MKVCHTCKGNKTINGMGYVKEKCKKCEGKGYIVDVSTIKSKPSTSKKKGSNNDEKEARS